VNERSEVERNHTMAIVTVSGGIIALVGAVLALVLARTVVQVARSSASKVPGPWYSNWTSLVLDLHFLYGTRSFYVHALHEQYGEITHSMVKASLND